MLNRFAASAHTYEIQEVLGESHFSLVYLAQRLDKDLKIKQTLVIKQFKQKKSPFLTLQMESLLRARHSSHLVKVLSFEKFKSRPALLLEHISGVNLKQLMKHTELNQNEIACLCSQILTGLEELKKNGLAHGDLSPSNILIDTKGQVYLTDYGLANYKNNTFYGTKPFIAPELYEGGRVCFQSDLFALGVLEKILKGHFTEEELTSMESKNFIHKEDSLLNPNPQNRNKKTFPYSPNSFLSLGNKVHQILLIRNYFTQKHTPPPSLFSSYIKEHFRPSYRAFYMGTIFFLFLFTANPFISYGKYIPPKKPAEVLVRTQKWTHIQMAGFEGYTPINIRINKAGTYKLKWKKQNSTGLKYIYLRSGQKILLRDNDFP